MESIVKLVESGQYLEKIRDALSSFSKKEIEEHRIKENISILHYAILKGHTELVRYLFARQYFSAECCKTLKYPFLHVACLVGSCSVIGIVLRESCQDTNVKIAYLDYIKMKSAVESFLGNTELQKKKQSYDSCINGDHFVHFDSKSGEYGNNLLTEKNIQMSAIDIAAKENHLKCVSLMLNLMSIEGELGNGETLECSVRLNSYFAFHLILNQGSYSENDLVSTFKYVLRGKIYQAVDAILHKKPDIWKDIFNGLNPFHVIYMYSSAFHGTTEHTALKSDLAECTKVLINHGIGIGICKPAGSYPLYSLIYALVNGFYPDNEFLGYVKSLHYLLHAGADTNFDELKHYDSDNKAFGRDLYTSALNCFFMCLRGEINLISHLGSDKMSCLKKLLENGADLCTLDSFGETPLHDVINTVACFHSRPIDLSIIADDIKLLRLLLQFGANLNIKSSNGLYPVQYYFSIFTCQLSPSYTEKICENWIQSGKMDLILYLLCFMDHIATKRAAFAIMAHLANEIETSVPDDFKSYVFEKVSDLLSQPFNLKLSVIKSIWSLVNRNRLAVLNLGLPNSLAEDIISFPH